MGGGKKEKKKKEKDMFLGFASSKVLVLFLFDCFSLKGMFNQKKNNVICTCTVIILRREQKAQSWQVQPAPGPGWQHLGISKHTMQKFPINS